MRCVMAGGGTGGHLFPGLALAKAMQKIDPDALVSFIGTVHGLDLELVPRAGYDIDIIAAGRGSPINRKKPWNLPRFLWAIGQSVCLLRHYKPDVVVALGGFAAAAPGIAARICGIPLVILEQNSIPGRVNRFLSRWAKGIYLQFRSAREHFTNTKATFYDLGSPMRQSIASLADDKPCAGQMLLVMGGSQGAQKLNDLAIEAMPEIIAQTGCGVIHVAGSGNEQAVRERYEQLGVDAKVFGFMGEMQECYRRSKLVLSRSGAGSIAELCAAGLPSVMIPLPSAMDNHQFYNARWLEERGAALLLEQDSLSEKILAGQVVKLLNDEDRLLSMADASRRLSRPQAAEDIARSIVKGLQS